MKTNYTYYLDGNDITNDTETKNKIIFNINDNPKSFLIDDKYELDKILFNNISNINHYKQIENLIIFQIPNIYTDKLDVKIYLKQHHYNIYTQCVNAQIIKNTDSSISFKILDNYELYKINCPENYTQNNNIITTNKPSDITEDLFITIVAKTKMNKNS